MRTDNEIQEKDLRISRLLRIRCKNVSFSIPNARNRSWSATEPMRMEMNITRNRNAVPHLGCRRENFFAFSGVSSSPASLQYTVLCSAP